MVITIICLSQGDRGRRGQVGLPGPAGPRVNTTDSGSSGMVRVLRILGNDSFVFLQGTPGVYQGEDLVSLFPYYQCYEESNILHTLD